MKKQYACLLLTVAGFLAFGAVAEAQLGKVVVTVPFEFVAAGRTLPAGTYTVSGAGLSSLAVSSYDNRAGVFVIPTQFESLAAGSPKLSFEQVGDIHFLSKIETPDGVYSIPVPRSTNLVARTKKSQSMSASGAN